jgi:hypothetical protein
MARIVKETITTRLVKIVTTIITISGIVVMLHSNNHVVSNIDDRKLDM